MVHAIAADAPNIAAEAVGAFPLYGPGRRVVGYRPTQDACLMRDMRRRQLCPICREALWENLLLSKGARAARISLLHSIRLRSASVDGGGDELVESRQPRPARPPAGGRCGARVGRDPRAHGGAARGGGEPPCGPARGARSWGACASRGCSPSAAGASRRRCRRRTSAALECAASSAFAWPTAAVSRRASLGHRSRGASACGAFRATERRWRGRVRPAEMWSRRPPIAPSIYVDDVSVM